MARTYFENLPSTNTPLRAERFNGLLNGEESIEKIVTGNIEGKNIFDGELELGNYSTSTGEKTPSSSFVRNKNFIPVDELKNYKFSLSGSGIAMYVFEYKQDFTYNLTGRKTINASSYLTTNSGTKYINFRIVDASTDVNAKIQIEKGNQATDYVPFMKYGYNSEESMGNIVVDDISCKNLLDFSKFEATTERNGITFTNNGDGTITVNGTATNNASMMLLGDENNQKGIVGNYITGGINSNVTVRVVNKTGSTYTILGTSSGSPSTINKSFGTGYIELRVANGTTVNNQIIKPMMTYNEDSNFTPYKSFDNSESEVYSTNEIKIGTWSNGKPLYRKVITFGALPNNDTMNVSYSSTYDIVDYDIICRNPNNGFKIKLPVSGSSYINTYIDSENHAIKIACNTDRSSFTSNYAIINFTKTTD